MALLDYKMASIAIQSFHSSCNLGCLSRLAAFLPVVCSGSVALSRQSSLIALSQRWDDFGMLKNPVRWVREMVFEVRLRSSSRLISFVGWNNVRIFSIPLSSRS